MSNITGFWVISPSNWCRRWWPVSGFSGSIRVHPSNSQFVPINQNGACAHTQSFYLFSSDEPSLKLGLCLLHGLPTGSGSICEITTGNWVVVVVAVVVVIGFGSENMDMEFKLLSCPSHYRQQRGIGLLINGVGWMIGFCSAPVFSVTRWYL